MTMTPEWDLFVSHATEDKADFVIPLVAALERRGVATWFDQCVLTVGDSLRARIDEGLFRSRHGAVILSPFFFAKDWPRMELDGLLSRERYGSRVILPVWHNVSRDDVVRFSPILASRVAISSARGVEVVADELRRAMASPSLPAARPVAGASDSPRPMDLARDADDLGRFYGDA